MRYFIVLDSTGKIIRKYETSSFDSQISNTVEVSKTDYDTIDFSTYIYMYVDGTITNVGTVPVIPDETIPVNEQILEGINLLLELQADMLGGAI